MDDMYIPVAEMMKDVFAADIQEFRGEISFVLKPEHIVEAVKCLKVVKGYKMLVNLTAVDYWPEAAPRFHMIYHLRNMQQQTIVSIRVHLDGNSPQIHTIEGVFPNANWFEREVWDLFGISFVGHSDMRRIVMPYEWVGHPLRKNYPLGYEEVQFSFNYEEINLRKYYAKE